MGTATTEEKYVSKCAEAVEVQYPVQCLGPIMSEGISAINSYCV